MSLECQKCDKLFITQADYDAHPCNQATSSSSGQRVQSSQNNAVPDDPVAKAEREVEKLCEQIDKIESLAHEKYRRSEPGFLKNAVTCVVSYNGNEQEWTEAFAHLVKLKDRLKTKEATLLSVHRQIAADKERAVNVKYEVPLFLSELNGRNMPDKLWRYVGSLPTWIFDSRIRAERKKGSLHSGSDPNTSNSRVVVAKATDKPCAMCGTRTGVTSGHILRQESHATELGIAYGGPCNILPLCGTKGMKGSCHHMFDCGEAGFCKLADGWKVIGGTHHGKDPAFAKPDSYHPRSLHTHLAWCLVGKTIMYKMGASGLEKDERIWEWVESLEREETPLEVSPERRDSGSCYLDHSENEENHAVSEELKKKYAKRSQERSQESVSSTARSSQVLPPKTKMRPAVMGN